MLFAKIGFFIYLLVATRLFLFQVSVLWSTYKNNGAIRFVEEEAKKIFLKRVGLRSISMIFLWPLDFITMPITYIKAFLLFDKMSIVKASMQIGKSRF
jgi:hypothetical protein